MKALLLFLLHYYDYYYCSYCDTEHGKDSPLKDKKRVLLAENKNETSPGERETIRIEKKVKLETGRKFKKLEWKLKTKPVMSQRKRI